jgi:hypothetical protein
MMIKLMAKREEEAKREEALEKIKDDPVYDELLLLKKIKEKMTNNKDSDFGESYRMKETLKPK